MTLRRFFCERFRQYTAAFYLNRNFGQNILNPLSSHMFSSLRYFIVFLLILCMKGLSPAQNPSLKDRQISQRELAEMFMRDNAPLQLHIDSVFNFTADTAMIFSPAPEALDADFGKKAIVPSIYELPFSLTGRAHD